MTDLSYRMIRGYEIRQLIGAGGFGMVYRAYQPAVMRDVAIKVINPELANNADFIRRFEIEAQLIARLEHPFIVPLYDYWREPDRAFLVMRWLPGGSLRADLKANGPWNPELAARFSDQIASALNLAHQHGVIHRDLKPDNILLDADRNAYLADFGIAKDTGSSVNITQPNMMVGSPAYVSPEQAMGMDLTPQSDIYSFGLILYELLTGAHPFNNSPVNELIFKQINITIPLLQNAAPGLPGELDTVLQKATAKDPHQRFANAREIVVAFHTALQTAQKRPTSPSTLLPDDLNIQGTLTPVLVNPDDLNVQDTLTPVLVNPYKGLYAFQEADATDFFGRTALIERILARLAETDSNSRFLAVIGPSGSGKSSVVRAGLIPAIRRGKLPGSDQWFIAQMIPGFHPLEELELALLRVAVNPPASLLDQLREDERGLLRAVRRILPEDQGELVLIIDQFEELFTLAENQAESIHLLSSLQTAVTDRTSHLRVIVTLRADFYDRPLIYPGFSELIRQRTEVVLPLTIEELHQSIAQPAERVGLKMETGLVEAIIQDVSEQPGTLPLLQYALTELCEHRQTNRLTLAEYRARGGVPGALARRAEELYAGFGAAQQAVVRQLFLRLVTLGEGIEDTRRRVDRAELASLDKDRMMESTIDIYAKYRLLTLDHNLVTRGPTVEVAHEALLRTWAQVRQWLDESREDLRLQRQLTAAAIEWRKAGYDISFLATGARLAHFEVLAAEGHMVLNQEEMEYLKSSVVERDRQTLAERERQAYELDLARQATIGAQRAENSQRRAANQFRYLTAVLTVLLFLVAILLVLAADGQAKALSEANSRATQQKLAMDNASTAKANADSLALTESRLLAANAEGILEASGNQESELAALLGIRALETAYCPEADAVLLKALTLSYTRQIFGGHTDSVTSVAFSLDGRYVLTGSWDATARLWDAQTGKELRQFTGHTAQISSLALSSDSRVMVTGSYDSTGRLWDIQSGVELRQFVGHADVVTAVAFSPDGHFVLTGSRDKTARLWDTQTGQTVRTFSGHTDDVTSVAFAPDGKTVLTGSSDKTARMWDIQSGIELRQFVGHIDGVTAVAFSPDGHFVLTGSRDKTARLWDIQTGKELRQFTGHASIVWGVVFSPDSHYILTGSHDKTARLWDAQTGKELRQFTGHTDSISGVAFSADGHYVLTGSDDKTARLWDIQAGIGVRRFTGHTNAVTSVAFSPDSRYVLTGSSDRTARLWDARTGQELKQFIGHTSDVVSVALSPDGRYALTGGRDNTARLWDIQTGQELKQFIGHTSFVDSVAFSPDGKFVLTGSKDFTARLWDIQSGVEIRRLTGHTSHVLAVAFSPDSRYILTGSADGTARLWDIQSGVEIRRLTGHTTYVGSVAFSPDGRYALTGSGDKTARLWDIQTGKELHRFVQPIYVLGVAFSPDGKYAATNGGDDIIDLWDTETGGEVRHLMGPANDVLSVAFSPDGKYMVTGSTDSTAQLWPVLYCDFVAFARTRVFRDFTDQEQARFGINGQFSTCQ